jgi:amidohydrolase
LVRWRRDLHQIPELGHEETKTAAYLVEALQGMGLAPRQVTATGLMADIVGDEPGPTVAVRADMDGLPVDEDSGEPFRSQHPGRMHACGHDGHMAIVLGVAATLAERRHFPGRVRILFQPSEERPPGGAPQLIAAGCLDGVDAVLGLHIWNSLPVGTASLEPGVVMANADAFRIAVTGRGGHGSEPHNARDAVFIAAAIVTNLQAVVSRYTNPLRPAVVTCGAIHAGTAFNIIAETAEILGTVRTLDDETKAAVRERLELVAGHTAAMYGATAVAEYQDGYPAVRNHPDVTRVWRAALADRVTLVPSEPSLGGEDFAYYLHHRPGAFLFLGAAPRGDVYPHHSPHFRFDEAALPIGVDALLAGVTALQREARRGAMNSTSTGTAPG